MSDWISVKDKVPTSYPVLAYVGKQGESGGGMFVHGASGHGGYLMSVVTHWMPLPSPPTDSEER